MIDSPFVYMQTYKNEELLTSTDNKTEESEKERFHKVNLYNIDNQPHNLQHTIDISSRIALMEKGSIIKDLPNSEASAENELEEYFK